MTKFTQLKPFEKALHDRSLLGKKVFLILLSAEQERAVLMQKIVSFCVPKDHDIEKFSADVEFKTISDALLTDSLFVTDKVVYLDGIENLKKKDVDLLISFLEIQKFSAHLILGAKGKTPLTKCVEKIGVVIDLAEEKPWDKEKRLVEVLTELAKQEGKWITPDAISLLISRIGSDYMALTQELSKLICFIGDRPTIERSDIFKISPVNQLETPWQMAEEIVWEDSFLFDPSIFQSLIFALRSQLQMGLKMTSLMQDKVPFSEWNAYFPKVWPRTLEKRKQQAVQKGSLYFQKGLKSLSRMEFLSRNGNTDPNALFDLFRASLRS